jgi:hypothetical protein
VCFKGVLPKVVEHWNLDSARYTQTVSFRFIRIWEVEQEKNQRALDCWTERGMGLCMFPKKKNKLML